MTAAVAPGTIVCWGELLWDLFPDRRRLGGASANVAYHAAQLGEKAVLVSRVGNDELGALALRTLESSGVSVEFVQSDPEAPTGTVQVELVDGEPRYRIATQVAWDRIEWRDDLAPVLEQASAVCFGTLAQREPLAFDTLERALCHTSSAAARICDLNVRPPFASRTVIERALGLSTALKLNEAELASLAEIFGQRDALGWLLQERGMWGTGRPGLLPAFLILGGTQSPPGPPRSLVRCPFPRLSKSDGYGGATGQAGCQLSLFWGGTKSPPDPRVVRCPFPLSVARLVVRFDTL